MAEQVLVTVLTAGAITLNVVTAVRAIGFSMALESGCVWVCATVGNTCVMRMLHGIATICFILATLKIWSIFDIFIYHWEDMPQVYHIRSFAYLGENYGVAMLGYALITMFKQMTKCNTSKRFKEYRREIARLEAKNGG